MSDRETVIVGSGQRWLNGKESSKQYFLRAERAATSGSPTMGDRLLDLLHRLVEGRQRR
ncbi:hypothetical protein ACFU53_13730 [Streptomyces sp. NPDC057474]|uniref:hypothetical protein n=1 Tax=Streptomyces sp. NPDC057474 TaxID=3346144 RepID=UPI0036930942